MAFRYLDAPIILTDGSVLRFPMGSFAEDARGNLRRTVRLFKRRRRCSLCRHHHGPTRNHGAKVCCAATGGGPCGCRHMVDWGSAQALLGR